MTAIRASASRLGVPAAALGAVAVGYVLATGSGRFGPHAPLAMLLVVLLPVSALAVLVDPRLGVLGVFAVFPVGFNALPISLDVVQTAIIAVTGLVVLRRLRADGAVLEWSPAFWWVVALLAWTLLGTPGAADPSLAMRRLPPMAAQLFFGAAIVTVCRKRGDVRLVAGGLVAIVAVVGLSTLGGADQVSTQLGGSLVSGRANGIFSEPNQLGSFTALGALVALGLALGLRTRRTRMLAALGAAGAIAGMLLSFSRGAWIGFGMGVLVLVVHVPSARRMLAVGTVVLFVFAGTYGALRPQSPEVTVVGERFKSLTGEKNPYDDRPAVWAEARREIAVDPLTGHGLGNFPLVAQRSTSRSHTSFPPHAHNLLLNFGAETGVPGMLFIIGFGIHLTVLTRRAVRRMRAEGRMRDAAVLAGLAGAALSVFGQGFVDYVLWSSVVFTAVWAVLGALTAMIELELRR